MYLLNRRNKLKTQKTLLVKVNSPVINKACNCMKFDYHIQINFISNYLKVSKDTYSFLCRCLRKSHKFNHLNYLNLQSNY